MEFLAYVVPVLKKLWLCIARTSIYLNLSSIYWVHLFYWDHNCNRWLDSLIFQAILCWPKFLVRFFGLTLVSAQKLGWPDSPLTCGPGIFISQKACGLENFQPDQTLLERFKKVCQKGDSIDFFNPLVIFKFFWTLLFFLLKSELVRHKMVQLILSKKMWNLGPTLCWGC